MSRKYNPSEKANELVEYVEGTYTVTYGELSKIVINLDQYWKDKYDYTYKTLENEINRLEKKVRFLEKSRGKKK